MQKIKVMADYCATALWNTETYANIAYEDVNLSDDLIADLKRWVRNYEINNKDYDENDSQYHKFDYDQFNIDGIKLAHRVKLENPNACVTYYVENINDPFLVEIYANTN